MLHPTSLSVLVKDHLNREKNEETFCPETFDPGVTDRCYGMLGVYCWSFYCEIPCIYHIIHEFVFQRYRMRSMVEKDQNRSKIRLRRGAPWESVHKKIDERGWDPYSRKCWFLVFIRGIDSPWREITKPKILTQSIILLNSYDDHTVTNSLWKPLVII